MRSLVDSRGRRVQLGSRIGGGGEADVFDVTGRPGEVAKIYQPGRSYPADKLAAMLVIPDQPLRSLCAWPTDVLLEGKTFVGFLMPKIAGRRPLFDLYVPKLRLQHFPGTNWRFLVRAAENTARAVHHIHQAGVVIGDVSHSNLLVADDATVRVIDTDSFQITDGKKRWLGRVGTGDYQPPEMQGLTSYQGIVRTANHDNFGLAVIIFQLLFAGRHPFSGRWQGQGDAPAIEEAIKACRYVYSQRRKTGFQPPSSALSIDALPDTIRDRFERAFDPRATNGGRPTAEQWMTALQALDRTVRQCRSNRWHWFYTGATNCPWCEIEQSGAVLFGATVAPQPSVSAGPPQTPQAASPPPAPAATAPPVPVLLSRQTAVRLFAWTRAHWKAIAWVTGFSLMIWLASRPDATPPPPQSLRPQSAPQVATAAAPPVRKTSASPPLPSPSPADKPAPSPPPAKPAPAATPSAVAAPARVPLQLPPPPAPIPRSLPTVIAPAPPSAAAVPLPTQPRPLQPQPAVQSAPTIGPSYDCAKARTPLPTFICSDAALSRVDVEMVQPYYVLRQLVGKDGWQDLLYEAIGFQDQTAYDCKISDAGELPGDLVKLKTCLLQAYKEQRRVWLQKLQGAGREEAERPVEQHVALQARLQTLGYLPVVARIDGVYGTATRAAIVAWQTAAQLAATGLLSTSDALRLMAQAPPAIGH